MSSYSGIVQNITANRRVAKKTGKPFTVYSAQVGGEWFQYGFNKPTFVVGDEIEFDYETSSYGKEFKKGAPVLVTVPASTGAAPTPVATTPVAPAPSKRSGGGRQYEGVCVEKEFPLPELHPDRVIVRQNMLSHATQIVNAHYVEAATDDVDEKDRAEAVIAVARILEEYATGYDIVKSLETEEKASS